MTKERATLSQDDALRLAKMALDYCSGVPGIDDVCWPVAAEIEKTRAENDPSIESRFTDDDLWDIYTHYPDDEEEDEDGECDN